MLTKRILSTVCSITTTPALARPPTASGSQQLRFTTRYPSASGFIYNTFLPKTVPVDSSAYDLAPHQVFAIETNYNTSLFTPNTIFVLYNQRAEHLKRNEVLERKKQLDIEQSKHFRKKLNQENSKQKLYALRENMTSHVDIASTPTADTPGACLYVHFDKRRYMFGRLAEGTQRVMNQRKYQVSTLQQFFVTGDMSWKTIGGMMGIIMTVSDVINNSRDAMQLDNQQRISKGQKPLKIDLMERLHVHGADNLSYLMATARSFIFRTGIPFKTIETWEDPRLEDETLNNPDWEDDCLRIWKLPIYPKSNKRRHDGSPASPTPNTDTPEAREQRKRDKEALSAVVENMFNSSWSIDKLVPTMLHDVVLPAKIFAKGDDGTVRLYSGPKPSPTGDNTGIPNIEVLVREPWPATKVAVLPPPLMSGQAMCYIAQNHARRGKFKPQAAIELGVQRTDFKILTNGGTIEVDGKTITPEMVMEEGIAGKGFIVADIPDRSYLESFFARPEFRNPEIMSGISMVYWMLPANLISEPNLQRFMRENSHLKHIVCAPNVSPNMMAFESYGTIFTALHGLDPDRYPILQFDNSAPAVTVETTDASGNPKPLYEIGRVGKRIRTMPQLEEKPENVLPFPDLMSRFKTMNQEILAMSAAAKERIASPEFLARVKATEADLPGRDTEIITLGTGSAVPSKYRNVSATLIRVPSIGSYLLDCGENTLGQIRRLYGYERAAAIIADLKFIFISHLHADHHLGIVTVLEEWLNATAALSPAPMLTVGCTRFMKNFLDEYAAVRALDLSRLRFSGLDAGDRDFRDTFSASHPCGLSSAHYVAVNHCKDAHAGVFTWPSGLKISYSGDCRPSKRFADIGRGSTVLIHECTFESDKRSDAIAKKHSTMAEALEVASNMRARRLLLTHFSQRYAKLPAQQREELAAEEEEGLSLEEKEKRRADAERVVLMGCDQMTVKIGEFQHAAEFLPAVLRFLQDEEKE